jgi:CubicO group peptidase (beta-lactamase class C family)
MNIGLIKKGKTMRVKLNTKVKVNILWIYLLLFFLVFNGYAQTSEESIDLSQLETYFVEAMRNWKIPGMAVAIVKDDKVVLAKGFGVKEYSKEDKVDEMTLFAIASNTKAFTAAALSILVDEGKIEWDDRVCEYLPFFRLYDPYVTEEMRIRDLLCHRSGLGTFSGDLLWYETPYTAEEVVKRARYLKPVFGFRSGYGYSNIMFMAAGEIIPAATGKKWEDFVKERIFTPMGMQVTHVGTSKLKKHENVATPHYVTTEGETLTISYTSSDVIASAGGINSNVSEMSRWLIMLLNNGVFDNTRILSEDQIWEMWKQHTVIPVSKSTKELFPTNHFNSYGLGWGLSDYHGHKIVSHGGGLDGMISRVAMVPEINLGLVVLTNSINSLPSALSYKIIDTYLGVPSKDWSQIYLERDRKSSEEDQERIAKIKEKITMREKTAPTPKLEDFTGSYGGPMYGDAVVTLEKDHLVLNFLPTPVFISDLTYMYHDTFLLKLRNKFSFIPHGIGTVQFLRDMDGKVVEMKVDIPNHDFFFTELEFKKKEEKTDSKK